MNCTRVQDRLVDLLYEELPPEDRASITAHLEACPDCLSRWNRLRAVASAADRWSAPPVSRGIAERALVRVAAEQHTARKSMWSSSAIVGRVLLGGGAALLSLLLVAGVMSRQASVVGIGALGVLWTVLYSGVFLLSHHPAVRGLTRAALIGAGVALIVVPAATVPDLVEACARWVRAAQSSAPLTVVLVVVAAGYTAGPLLAGALLSRTKPERKWIVRGLKLSALYALMVAPAVALQCVALPLEVMAVWMTGALMGVAVAGPAGLRLGGWLRQTTQHIS